MEEEDEAMSTAIRVFAHYLGVDLDTEEDLLPAVREGFYSLPKDWEVGIGEDEHAGIPYFYNSVTGESDWKHPKEEICFKKVRIARERKRERQASRGRGNNRDRERDTSISRRDGSVERPASRQEVAEVEVFDIVEDLEESSRPKSPPEKPGVAELPRNTQQSRSRELSPVKTHETAARGNTATGGFGMSSADFLDGDVDSVAEKPNRNTSSAGGSARGIDNSMSPPLFKEMRDGSYQSPGADSEDPRDLRPIQRTGHSRQGSHSSDPRAGKESGWTGAGPSDSVLGGHREDQERELLPATRRDYNSAIHGQQEEERVRGDRERDTDRDPYIERGRSTDRGGGRGSGGGRGRGRDWDRDRDFRDSRDRDLQGRGDWGRDRGQSRGRNDREGRERTRDRAFSLERDGDEDVGPSTHRSRASDGLGRESGRSSQETGRGREIDRDYLHQRSSSVGAGDVVGHVSEKERELRAEVDRYQVDVHKLGADNAELADKLASVRSKHAGELTTLRDEVSRLELRLAEERRERKTLEDQVTQAHSEHHSKTRDLEDMHEIRLRDAVRKARTEADEEFREKLRGADRRHLEEADGLRAEMALLKRKLEETQREADNSKRKITLSKADGKMEAQAEADALRVTVRECEEQERRQAQEMRRLREENASVQGRLVAALQAVQVANAESDALRATATTAVHDEQAQSGAVTTALQRIQHLDTECAQLKAENIILRREKEAHLLEIRKLRGTADFSGERLSTTETEARRLKAQAQAEASRLTSRATELEALVSVLRGQLDQASSHEAQAVREVQRSLDSAEAESARLKDRMADREVTEEALSARIKSHERELIRLQEVVFKKDRQIREEQEKGEGVQAQIDGIRRSYEQELEVLKTSLTKQKKATAELAQQQRQEVERIEAEVAEKVPDMIASAVAQVETRCANKHNKDLADLKLAYELQRDKLKQENSDLQNIYAEKDARQRLQQTDEKVELEKLRMTNKSLQRRSEELEEQVLELRRQIRVASNNSAYSGVLGQQGARRAHGNVPGNRNMNTSYQGHGAAPRSSHDFSEMLEHSFDHVRGSGNGSFFHPPYDPRFDAENNENYYDQQQVSQFDASRSDQDTAMAHTMSFINDQLAFMKRQISSSLQQPPSRSSAGSGGRTGASSTTALVAVDDAAATIDQSMFSTASVPNATAPLSVLSRPSTSAHHVTFSPEALFSSPQSKSHRRSRAGDSSSFQETLRAVHDSAPSGSDTVVADGVRESASEDAQHEEVETLDEPQHRPQRGSSSIRSAPAPSSSAVDRSYDALSDVSYLDTSALGASMSAYSVGGGYGGAGRYAVSTNRSSMLGLSDFSAISDGGYHEGYWRAKYIRNSKQ